MVLAKTKSAVILGVTAELVDVEANIGRGLPGMYIGGLKDTTIAESPDRIKTAIINSGLAWPKTKIIVNLAPASMKKSGSQLDLALGIAVLVAALNPIGAAEIDCTIFLGELSLDGQIKSVPGLLPMLVAARSNGIEYAVIPREDRASAQLVQGLKIYLANTIAQVYHWITGEIELDLLDRQEISTARNNTCTVDMRDVAGQPEAKYAAELAATGKHHFMMLGPPGSGKSMIAERLPSIMPELSEEETLEATSIHSVVGDLGLGPIYAPPFIAPHHSLSRAALLGGGSGAPKPGAVSMAHAGILFLDEVSEIPAAVLDSLRTPLESREVQLIRSHRTIRFPANFQLVLAANLCRCGAEDLGNCRCSSQARMHYLSNVSGPIKDRIDMAVTLPAQGSVLKDANVESSAEIAQRVLAGREHAQWRWEKAGFGSPQVRHISSYIWRRQFPADEVAMLLLDARLSRGEITQRSVDRALRLAWTMCDLEEEDRPTMDHVSRALDFRFGLRKIGQSS